VQNSILYGALALALFVFAYMFVSSPDAPQEDSSTEVVLKKEEKQKKEEPKRDVKIVYEQTKEFKKELESPKQSEEPKALTKEVAAAPEKEEQKHEFQNVYTLIGSAVNTQDYTLAIVSNSKIESKRGLPPTLPATVNGSIDGQSFRLVIPTNLSNSDLRIKVADKNSGEEREVSTIDITTLKPASVNILTLFYNDIGSAHLIRGESAVNDAPPMPPLPDMFKK